MNKKILAVFLLLLLTTGIIASRQCYKCTACPIPFKGNEASIQKVDVGDNDYCKKTVIAGIQSRDAAGSSCTPINQQVLCCQGNLCNGASAFKINIQLLATISALMFIIRFFQ